MISAHRLDHAGLTPEERVLLRTLADDDTSMGASSYANLDNAKVFTEIIADRVSEVIAGIRTVLARMDVTTAALDPQIDRDLNGAETRLRQARYVIERALNFLRTARGRDA